MPKRAEVIRRDRPDRGKRLFGTRRDLAAVDLERAIRIPAIERRRKQDGGRLDLRLLLDALEDALVERGLALAVRICGLWQRQRYEGDVLGVEPRVDVLQSEEAVREESRRDEQNERQRNLRNDQHGARPGASPSGGGGPIGIAQCANAVGS